jgi:hypothetical protein
VPGVERQPLKKLTVDESVLLKLLIDREEAEKAGRKIDKRVSPCPNHTRKSYKACVRFAIMV